MKRKEAPRYFALAMDYSPLNPDPDNDETINTKSQNEIDGIISMPYKIPAYKLYKFKDRLYYYFSFCHRRRHV